MEGRSRKKSRRGIFLVGIVYCLFFAVCFFDRRVYAAEQSEAYEGGTISLAAEFCFQDEESEEITLRAGRDFALRLTVTAQGTGFSGHVNVLMLNARENHVLYQEEITGLAAGESEECVMLLPMNLMTEGLYLTLTDADDKAVLEWTIPVDAVNYGLYEVVAVFDPVLMADAEPENPYAHFSSYGSRLVKVSEEEMACGVRAMDALEVIVTQESALEKLEAEEESQKSAEALESLQGWVASGKTLVVGASTKPDTEKVMLNLGLQEQEILQAVILRIGNYESARNSILATNEELKKQYGENAHTSYIGDSMIWPVLVNSLSDEAVRLPVKLAEDEKEWWWEGEDEPEVIWQEKGIDILRCYHVGKGQVLVFAVPITCEESSVYPLFYYRLVQLVLDNLTQKQQSRQNTEMYGYEGTSEEYLLMWMETEQDGISVLPYIIILTVYIVILLPAVFLLLRRFGKTKYLWGVLPALSLVMMGVVYLAGRRTRITEPYCNYLDITDYTEGKGRESVYFALSAPTNKGTEIMLKKGSEVRLEETYFRAYEAGWSDDYVSDENILLARNYRAAVSNTAEGTRLSLDTIAAFSKTTFYAWTDAKEYAGFAASVTVQDGQVSGTISNQSGEAFREVFLCGSSYLVRLGGMLPDETVDLSLCEQKYLDYEMNWYSDEVYELVMDGASSGRENYNERIALRYLMSDYLMLPQYVLVEAEVSESVETAKAKEPEHTEETAYIFAVASEPGSDILGSTAVNPGSSGMRVVIWPVSVEAGSSIESNDSAAGH